MRGNPGEYPPPAVRGDTPAARRLRALVRATHRTSSRFDSLAEARRLGYEMDAEERTWPHPCPGTWHLRKHGVRAWGSTLDPAAPQALMYWCDARGRWTLAANMYRAPSGTWPDTFGDLLQWHKHAVRATWMTHVWIVRDLRAALATCMPFAAFERASRLSYAHYRPDVAIDGPCSDTRPQAIRSEPEQTSAAVLSVEFGSSGTYTEATGTANALAITSQPSNPSDPIYCNLLRST